MFCSLDSLGWAQKQYPVIIGISGSDSMLVLTRLWAEEYMQERPGVSVYAWGGGSAKGIKDLIAGRVEIAAVSRPLLASEARRLAETFRTVGLSHMVAKEALSIYVNPQNPIKDLSIEELRLIFTGKIRNWSELGGLDHPIVVVRRSPASGTYHYFKEHVLEGAEYTEAARVMSDTNSIVEVVEENPFAIGYGGVAYGKPLHSRISGVAPTEGNIREGFYPITRYLYLLTVSSPRGGTKAFIDWVLGLEGQRLVREAGYVSLW